MRSIGSYCAMAPRPFSKMDKQQRGLILHNYAIILVLNLFVVDLDSGSILDGVSHLDVF